MMAQSLRDIISKAQYGKDVVIDPANNYELGDTRYIWTYGIALCCILSVLAWVRNIAVFSFTFLIANILLLVSVIVISGYSTKNLIDNGISPTAEAFIPEGVWTMVGFAVYAFEGIGILMPVMQASDCPEKFDGILISAILTLSVAFCIFGTVTYLAFGNMKEQLAT
jgi:amino acid permease